LKYKNVISNAQDDTHTTTYTTGDSLIPFSTFRTQNSKLKCQVLSGKPDKLFAELGFRWIITSYSAQRKCTYTTHNG